MSEEIKIKAEVDPSHTICRFKVSKTLLPDGSISCKSLEFAQDSLLLKQLFELEDVLEIFVNDNQVTIKKNESATWSQLAPKVGQVIRSALGSGRPLFPAEMISPVAKEVSAEGPSPVLNSDIGNVIKKLLEEQVRPALASHGGTVELVDIKDSKVYLRFGGGCHGCSQVSTTVKDGIEKLIVSSIASITGVVDVTDHTSGSNPYYN